MGVRGRDISNMRIYTELIVLYEDAPMPAEESFCPSIWQAADFDSDGDYYATGVEGRWTQLELTRREEGAPESTLGIYSYRENNAYEPGLQEIVDLRRYIDYHRQGRYQHEGPIAHIESLAVTSLCFDTPSVKDYREFLETVYRFLEAMSGHVVNYAPILDAAAFKDHFLCWKGI